jgi:hypothetical protein
MQSIEEQEVEQFKALEALVTAELEYYSQCTAILEELRSGFPTASTT